MKKREPTFPDEKPDAGAPAGKALTVLNAARDVFLSHGFSAATTDMIQQTAGVSKATVYAHYGTKEALFAAVIERQCAEHMNTLRTLQPTQGGVRAVLAELARAYLDFALAPGGLALVRVVTAEAPRFPQLARTFWEKGPQVYCGIVAEHLESAVKEGELELGSATAQEAAALFFSLVRGEGQLQCLMQPERRPSAAQKARWAELAVETFLRAFGR